MQSSNMIFWYLCYILCNQSHLVSITSLLLSLPVKEFDYHIVPHWGLSWMTGCPGSSALEGSHSDPSLTLPPPPVSCSRLCCKTPGLLDLHLTGPNWTISHCVLSQWSILLYIMYVNPKEYRAERELCLSGGWGMSRTTLHWHSHGAVGRHDH